MRIISMISSWLGNYVFYYPIVMSLVWVIGSFMYERRMRKSNIGISSYQSASNAPLVSVLVPAHNESLCIERTVENILSNEYPNFEIIVINDASQDDTEAIVKRIIEKHDRVRMINQRKNCGKAHALNCGLIASKGDILLCVDSDCFLGKYAIARIASNFEKHSRVGAVTGNPHIWNKSSILAKLQAVEYSCVVGLTKRSQRMLGKVMTVSGAIVAYRRQAVLDVGGWSETAATEDVDITWRLQRAFWDVYLDENVLCWIMVPTTLRDLFRQRVRWSKGGAQVARRNADILLSWKQHRFWIIFIDFWAGVLWAYSFAAFILVWLLLVLNGHTELITTGPLTLAWRGYIVLIVCVFQFVVSTRLDHHSDKNRAADLFFMVWYPIFYWLIQALAAIAGVPQGLLPAMDKTATWKSPSRAPVEKTGGEIVNAKKKKSTALKQ